MLTHLTLAMILGLAWGSGPPSPDEAVIFTRQDVVVVKTWKLGPDLDVEATGATGEPITIAGSALLALLADRDAAPSGSRPGAALRNGEVITGELATDQTKGRLALVSALWGRLEIPIEQVAAYAAASTIPEQKHPEVPFIVLRNGDIVAARIEEIGPDALTVNTEFGQTQIARSVLAAIVLSTDPPPVDGRRGPRYLVELTDGQRAYCDELSAPRDGVLAARRGDARCELDQPRVRRIVWPGATIGRASAMAFTGSGTGYFGQTVTPRRDRNALGRPLRLGQPSFARGIGTRPRSRVAFELDGRWMYLHGWVGLDPWSGRAGHCATTVMVDDRQAFRVELQRSEKSSRFTVPVRDAKRIELRADFGPRGDLGDYVNWCDLLLIGQRAGSHE